MIRLRVTMRASTSVGPHQSKQTLLQTTLIEQLSISSRKAEAGRSSGLCPTVSWLLPRSDHPGSLACWKDLVPIGCCHPHTTSATVG